MLGTAECIIHHPQERSAPQYRQEISEAGSRWRLGVKYKEGFWPLRQQAVCCTAAIVFNALEVKVQVSDVLGHSLPFDENITIY